MKKGLTINKVVAIGIGAAVFMILGRFAAIPTGIPNTEFATCYAFLALMAIIYGPKTAFAIGFLGHTLKDLTYGSPWFSWIIASAVMGLIIGFASKRINISDGIFEKKQMIIYNIYQVVANAIAWGFVAPTLDFVLYKEPIEKVYIQAVVAGVANTITCGILGTILIYSYSKTRIKKGSLKKEYL